MKCENCGNEVREGAKFCSKCGSNILEQQEDHSGKHNVHETKTEKRCVNCGNVLREESKFCPKCGSSTLEQKEDVSTLKDEEKDKAEQSKGTFYFEKVKMIPVIASGGAGKLEHFKDALAEGMADAALAASLFHYKELEIKEVKEYLRENGVSVRL